MCMLIFVIWYFFCSNLRLVDIHDIQLRPEALELAMFQNVVMRHIEIAKETLLKKYVTDCFSFAFVIVPRLPEMPPQW